VDVEAPGRAADLLRAELEELPGRELAEPVRDLREPALRALVEEPAQSAAYSAVVKLVSTKDLLPPAATVPIASV
jgi:hypothetical protein